MGKIIRLLAALGAVLLMGLPGARAALPVFQDYKPSDTGISGALLSSGPTLTLPIRGFSSLTLYPVLTRVAATALTATCTAGPSTLVQGPVSVANVNNTTGAITLVGGAFTWPSISTSGTFRGQIAPLNDSLLVCVFTGAGATSDTISLYARAAGQL